jgi:hypothetical protein
MKGRIGTPMVSHKIERRTRKAKHMGWCKRCRDKIYPGEWISSGKFDVHRYECPDPETAAAAYAKRLTAMASKRKFINMTNSKKKG